MDRKLVSEFPSTKAYSKVGEFANLDAVTIQVFKDGSSTPEAITTPTCTQISTVGIFFFEMSGLDVQPTLSTMAEYYWIMSDETTKKSSGEVVIGGWVESVPQALDDADECRVTVNLYKIGGGISPASSDLIFNENKVNHIELLAKFHDGSRYFALEKIKPSYSQDVAQAFWVLPRLSTVSIELQSFGITKKSKEIPDQPTIDLFDLLALP